MTQMRALFLLVLLFTGTTLARPASAYIPGLTHVRQTYNNCGPAALVSILGYYGLKTDQQHLASVLRPGGGYMRADVIDPFVRTYGLRAARYKRGSAEHLKQLVSRGVPVLVLQWLDREGGIPHFRTVRGYNDTTRIFYLDDPMYGENVYLTYADFERLWGVYGREFIPIYPTSWQPQVDAALNVKGASS